MTECCLVNTVDRQISAAQTHASALRRGLPSASLLWLKAIAMQAELWHAKAVTLGVAIRE